MEKNGANIPEAARLALERFEEEARAILTEELKPFDKSPISSVVYHYTNDIGLHGILKSGKLWLTDAFSLNDPSELWHGMEIALKVEDEKMKATGHKPRKDLLARLEERKKAFQRIAHYFLCSFSEMGDDLGQWRGYAHDGRGYALGFDWKMLDKAFSGESNGKFLVGYNEQDLRRVVEKLFDCMIAELEAGSMGFNAVKHRKKELRRVWDDFCRSMNLILWKRIFRGILHFKHHAYHNEAEYRFLKIQSLKNLNGIKFRPRNNELIKYIEFDWKSAGSDVLKEIIIGPAADLGKSKQFAEECLREAGINPSDVKIIPSGIPYKPA